MLYYLFRSNNLDNLFILEDDSSTTNWQLIYEEYFAYHSLYLIDMLKLHQ